MATKHLEEVQDSSVFSYHINSALPLPLPPPLSSSPSFLLPPPPSPCLPLLLKHAVQAIWLAIKDLIAPSHPTEVRHAAFVFTRALISGQVQFLVCRQHVNVWRVCRWRRVCRRPCLIVMLLACFLCAILEVYLVCIQFEYLGILRANFFRVVQEHPVKEDTQQR